MTNYEGYQIYMTVYGQNLLEQIEDVNEAERVSRYAELCQRAIEREYPGATVEVDYELNMGGAEPEPRAYDPEGMPCDDISVHIERICDEVYGAMAWNVPTDSGTIAKTEDGHIT